MTLEVLSFLFGASLITISIMGGGFEVKEVKIPKVGAAIRVFALLGGLFFVMLGVGTMSSYKENSSESDEPVTYIATAYCSATGIIGEGTAYRQKDANRLAVLDCIERGGIPECCADGLNTRVSHP